MKKNLGMFFSIVCGLALLVLGCNQQQKPDTRAADEASIRSINPAWFKAYNAGDAEAVAALYADDAVLNIPGVPATRGRTAIREALAKDIAGSVAGGLTNIPGPSPEFGVSGDLGWEWSTYSVTDKSGSTVDRGKYVTVYARKEGKWLIIRDIWNSNGPMQVSGAK